MATMILTLTVLALCGVLAYFRSSLLIWTGAFALLIAAVQLAGDGLSVWPWLAFLAIAVPLNVTPIRRSLLGRPLLDWFRSVLPDMSDTERTAIEAGTVWWDGDLFTGRPDWNKLLSTPAPTLTDEEQAFLDGPTDELCRMLDDWKINYELNDLAPEAWDFIKKNRFFGMIIPKKYGGLEFSPRAQSEVVLKVASRSLAAGVTVMVPNSLGPGELLLKYGTEEQKNKYLPRLARGEEIPSFALTTPYAGSDAGAMPDHGYLCKGIYQGKEVLGFRVNWEKRYITLGPVSTLLGLAFKAFDPEGLLGDKEDLGITCALIPTDTPGITIGNRHKPGGAFQNGPNSGKDVFVPMEWIIGGEEFVGKGWRMLMECLSVGRAISLPALGAGMGKFTSRMTGAYARIRKQFKIPIGKFEGIQEALARIAGLTYRMDAARCMTAGALGIGQKPAVLGAILKYHNTEGMRQVIDDAMDVHGGRAVSGGPRNYLVWSYRGVPVAITVEGANILTRSMIIFGQGAIRCHPYVLKEMLAAMNEDRTRGLRDFDEAIFAHIGFTISNAVRAFVTGLTRATFIRVPESGATTVYLKQISRMSAAFALVADVAMLSLGGELKRRERLSARLGDVLSHLYMASAVLKHHQDHGRPADELPLVHWAVRDSLYTIQTRLEEVLQNFPSRWIAKLLRFIILPYGRPYRVPDDKVGRDVAEIILNPSRARDALTQGIFICQDPQDAVGRMETAFAKVVASDPLEQQILKATGARVEPFDYEEPIRLGLEAGAISEMDAQLIREAMQAAADAIAVDEFPRDQAADAQQPVEVASAS